MNRRVNRGASGRTGAGPPSGEGVRVQSAVGVLRAALSTQRSRGGRTGLQREVGAAGGGGAGGLEGALYLPSSEVIRDAVRTFDQIKIMLFLSAPRDR